jgi:hypothetical protein
LDISPNQATRVFEVSSKFRGNLLDIPDNVLFYNTVNGDVKK